MTSRWSKLSITMYIVEHTADSVALGEGVEATEETCLKLPAPPPSSSSLDPSSRLIFGGWSVWHLPLSLTEINHFPMDFPWEMQEIVWMLWASEYDGTKRWPWENVNRPISVLSIDQIFSIYRVKRSLSPCNQTDSKCDEKKTSKTKIKLQDFEVLFTYTVQTFTLYLLLKCNLQTLAAILHRL